MALTAITTEDTYTYTPVSQRGEDNPFNVTFTRLSLEVSAEAQDTVLNLNNDQSMTLHVNAQNLLALRHGLTSWENLTDTKGKPVKFRRVRGVAATECLEYLPQEIRTEIASVILEVTKDPTSADALLSVTELGDV